MVLSETLKGLWRVPVVDNVSFRRKRAKYWNLGPNGAGKTTTLNDYGDYGPR